MQKRDDETVERGQVRGGPPTAPRQLNNPVLPGEKDGIEPRRPETMPRAEDDEQTFANSPEFHDRKPNDE